MIKVEQAAKMFGSKIALDDLSFSVEAGQIVGLVGANGAGKSTMLKAMAGLLHLDRGKITIDGKSPCRSTRERLAFLPDLDAWYPWMKLSDIMRYMQDLYPDWDGNKADHLLDYFHLKRDSLIKVASKGTRAKIKLLLVLSRQAKYLLLDEPFSGIDPFAREQIAHAIMEDFLEEEQTILIATHEVSEVEALLDEILFLDDGKLLLKGNVETLKLAESKSLLEILKEVYHHARL